MTSLSYVAYTLIRYFFLSVERKKKKDKNWTDGQREGTSLRDLSGAVSEVWQLLPPPPPPTPPARPPPLKCPAWFNQGRRRGNQTGRGTKSFHMGVLEESAGGGAGRGSRNSSDPEATNRRCSVSARTSSLFAFFFFF